MKIKPREKLNEIYGWGPGADEGSSEGHTEFKKQLKKKLVSYYEKDPEAGFLGYINRKVARILKQVWDETVDRGFINSVNKVHYMPINKLAEFLGGSDGKNEISTVGWLPSEDYKQAPGFPGGSWVGIRLEGWTTFAGNTNLFSGGAPIPGEQKKYKHSGVPKWADNTMSIKTGMISTIMHMNLTNLIRLAANNAVLDSNSFKSTAKRKKENSGILANLLGNTQTKHNEFVLDNWKPVEIVDFKGFWDSDPKVRRPGNARLLKNLSKKFNLPIASVGGVNEEKRKNNYLLKPEHFKGTIMKIKPIELRQIIQEVIEENEAISEGHWKKLEPAYIELKNLMEEYELGLDDLEDFVEMLKLDRGEPPEEEEDDTHWGSDTEMTVGGTNYHLKKDDDEDLYEVIKQELSKLLK